MWFSCWPQGDFKLRKLRFPSTTIDSLGAANVSHLVNSCPQVSRVSEGQLEVSEGQLEELYALAVRHLHCRFFPIYRFWLLFQFPLKSRIKWVDAFAYFGPDAMKRAWSQDELHFPLFQSHCSHPHTFPDPPPGKTWFGAKMVWYPSSELQTNRLLDSGQLSFDV